MKAVFVLPVKGGGGGAHSVAQEVNELNKMGIEAFIAVNEKNYSKFLSSYSDLPYISNRLLSFEGERGLATVIDGVDVVVATIFTSVSLIKSALNFVVNQPAKIAYYIQDYEPMFSEPNSPLWQEAFDSYTLIEGMTLFAKTDWIRKMVTGNHGVEVKKVSPSIDHAVYVPNLNKDSKRFFISAMVRPATPRRAPHRTMTLLRNLSEKYGDAIRINIFGCDDEDIEEHLLPQDFKYTNHGKLLRHQVASVLGISHLFIDLSDYQAFGRTGLEAMACGAVSLVPVTGGTDEYANHSENALVIDPRDLESCENQVSKLIEDRDAYDKLQLNAIHKSTEFSVRKAALSIFEVLNPSMS